LPARPARRPRQTAEVEPGRIDPGVGAVPVGVGFAQVADLHGKIGPSVVSPLPLQQDDQPAEDPAVRVTAEADQHADAL
jgi:hypothetical protein